MQVRIKDSGLGKLIARAPGEFAVRIEMQPEPRGLENEGEEGGQVGEGPPSPCHRAWRGPTGLTPTCSSASPPPGTAPTGLVRWTSPT